MMQRKWSKFSLTSMQRFTLLLAGLLFYASPAAFAQKSYSPKVTRILFVLDASGSMKDTWGDQQKYAVARKLLYEVADSIQRTGRNIEFGLRMFGHQSPRADHNCKDSKLEIPFGRANATRFASTLDAATPQGWTPIAYSLFLAANDFPNDPNAKNAIVLITDGLENCEGDPCATAELLQKKRISLKPFIIGLGIGEAKGKEYFDCVGTYYDASNAQTFTYAMDAVVSQALNTTSVQVNLMTAYERPDETDVEMTFYDGFGGGIRYNFMHTMDENKQPDTLFLDPVGKYDLTVHSIPAVEKKDIELIPGKHNIIAMDVPQGTLKLQVEGSVLFSNIQCVVRQSGKKEILYVQDMNTAQKYLVGAYDLEILSLPRIEKTGVTLTQSKETEITIPQNGTLSITSPNQMLASIYVMRATRLVRVYEFKKLQGTETLELLPGDYKIVFRPLASKSADHTIEKEFSITSSNITKLTF